MLNIRHIGSMAAIVALLGLAGCSSLPLDGTGKLRSLDAVTDDVASVLLAFDLPASLEPLPGASVLRLEGSERRIAAVLTETDAGELAARLPPPADQRNYYLFGFSEADKAAIREAQGWAKGLPPGASALSLSLAPRFCRTGEIDPAKVRISVLVALPGATALAPLMSNQPLSELLAGALERDVPVCAGHSG